MERGELYLGVSPESDPRRQRVYLIVSRPQLVASRYSSLICVPVYSTASGVPTEVHLDPEHGLKVASVLRCDEITSVQRRHLVRYLGELPESKMAQVNRAMAVALAISATDINDSE